MLSNHYPLVVHHGSEGLQRLAQLGYLILGELEVELQFLYL